MVGTLAPKKVAKSHHVDAEGPLAGQSYVLLEPWRPRPQTRVGYNLVSAVAVVRARKSVEGVLVAGAEFWAVEIRWEWRRPQLVRREDRSGARCCLDIALQRGSTACNLDHVQVLYRDGKLP